MKNVGVVKAEYIYIYYIYITLDKEANDGSTSKDQVKGVHSDRQVLSDIVEAIRADLDEGLGCKKKDTRHLDQRPRSHLDGRARRMLAQDDAHLYTHTHTHKHTHTHTHTLTQTDRQTDRHIHTQTDTQTQTHM
jgi:hypothetical protein